MSYQTQVITFTNDNGVEFTDVDAALEVLDTVGIEGNHNPVTGPLFHSLQDDGHMFADNIIVDGALVSTWVMHETAATQIAAAPQLTFSSVTVVYGEVGSVDTHAVLDEASGADEQLVDGEDPNEAVEDIAPGVHGVDPEPEPPASGGDTGWVKPGAHLNEDGTWSDEPA